MDSITADKRRTFVFGSDALEIRVRKFFGRKSKRLIPYVLIGLVSYLDRGSGRGYLCIYDCNLDKIIEVEVDSESGRRLVEEVGRRVYADKDATVSSTQKSAVTSIVTTCSPVQDFKVYCGGSSIDVKFPPQPKTVSLDIDRVQVMTPRHGGGYRVEEVEILRDCRYTTITKYIRGGPDPPFLARVIDRSILIGSDIRCYPLLFRCDAETGSIDHVYLRYLNRLVIQQNFYLLDVDQEGETLWIYVRRSDGGDIYVFQLDPVALSYVLPMVIAIAKEGRATMAQLIDYVIKSQRKTLYKHVKDRVDREMIEIATVVWIARAVGYLGYEAKLLKITCVNCG